MSAPGRGSESRVSGRPTQPAPNRPSLTPWRSPAARSPTARRGSSGAPTWRRGRHLVSIGRRAPSAAPHWMRRAARLCVASLTLYFVRQRPDTKGAPPLYLTPLPNGSFPWCPPDWCRYRRALTGHATLGGEIAPALTPPASCRRAMRSLGLKPLKPDLGGGPWAKSCRGNF